MNDAIRLSPDQDGELPNGFNEIVIGEYEYSSQPCALQGCFRRAATGAPSAVPGRVLCWQGLSRRGEADQGSRWRYQRTS
jgi:hypothetical protein